MEDMSFEEMYPNTIYKLLGENFRPEKLIWRHNTQEPFRVVIVARYDPDGLEYEYNLFEALFKVITTPKYLNYLLLLL